MTKEVTDYGVCYTFNGGEHPLPTEKTGSRFGLALTLNIEQYEYMRGPQSDAGVKVSTPHPHPQCRAPHPPLTLNIEQCEYI